MNALRVRAIDVKETCIGRYVEVSLYFFKALTFVNVHNETSNKQKKKIEQWSFWLNPVNFF